ncbi:unnamed protein product [Leptosia nina]|uniref:Uncharacterized protein n=1 Tax=Leptosia nina TaxID=320188 RepID=A0AAV1J313_9NEOP
MKNIRQSLHSPRSTLDTATTACKERSSRCLPDCVKQTVSRLNVLDYTCGECRRGGITSRAAAVRLAPRTIATLFMAKRRFNKYAHRQYMQKCKSQKESEPADRPDDDSDEGDDVDHDAVDPLPDDGD